jgi:large subunit ribosomal protein L30
MKKVRVTQVRSAINRPKRQKLTLEALGITKLNRPKEHVATPQIMGMINKVQHLLKVEEI